MYGRVYEIVSVLYRSLFDVVSWFCSEMPITGVRFSAVLKITCGSRK